MFPYFRIEHQLRPTVRPARNCVWSFWAAGERTRHARTEQPNKNLKMNPHQRSVPTGS